MTTTSKSPWAKPLDAPSAPPRPPQPAPRIPGLNYDDAVFPPEDDSDWTRNEGFVQDFAEAVERRVRYGKPGSADTMAAFDMMMRHEAAEMDRECRKMTGASLAQIQNPAFWRGLAPCRSALVDVLGMFMLEFQHDDDLMTASARFPEDIGAEGFTACGTSYDRLAASIARELAEWARFVRQEPPPAPRPS